MTKQQQRPRQVVAEAGGPAPQTWALPPIPHPTLCCSHSPSPTSTSAPQLCQLPHAGQMGPVPRRTRQDPKPPCVPSCHPTHNSKPFKPQKSHHLQDALASCPQLRSPLPTRSSPRAGTSPTCHPFPIHGPGESSLGHHSKAQQQVQARGPEGPESHFLGSVSPYALLPRSPPCSGWQCKTKRVPLSRLHNSASQQRPIFKS